MMCDICCCLQHDWEMEDEDEPAGGSRRAIATVLSGTVSGREAKKKVALLPSGQMHKKHMVRCRQAWCL